MHVTIANHRSKSFSFAKSKKDKAQFRRNVNFFKNSAKEAMFISKAKPGRIMKKPNWKRKGVCLSRMQRGSTHSLIWSC